MSKVLVSFFPSLSPVHQPFSSLTFFSLRSKKERDFGSSDFCLTVKVKGVWVAGGQAAAWQFGLVGSLKAWETPGRELSGAFLSVCPVSFIGQSQHFAVSDKTQCKLI